MGKLKTDTMASPMVLLGTHCAIVRAGRYDLPAGFPPTIALLGMIPWTNMSLESDLYAPVKALLEGQGYGVKGEVRGCDAVAVRGKDPPVIVELKRAFGLGLVLQGVDRLALSDAVYLAVGAWPKKLRNVKKLCRRVGLGLIVVLKERADVVFDPAPYAPRKNKRKAGRLLGEHV